MLDQLTTVENWLQTWLFEPEKWQGAMKTGEAGSTITSIWRTFGSDAQFNVALQIMHLAEPEKFEVVDGRYVLRICKGVLRIKQAVDFDNGPSRGLPRFKVETINEAVLAAGSIFISHDIDTLECLKPMTPGSDEVRLVRVSRADDDCTYKQGQPLSPKTIVHMVQQFRPMYGAKGRFG